MQKKTKFRSHLLDAAVITICLSLASVSVWLFFKDLNRSSVRSDKDKIGVIYFKHKVAQRKFNDRVVWERLSKDSILYNEDTIRTADFAQAIIQFVDGNILDVYENTMIQIYYSEEDGVKVSVDGGDVQLDSTSAKKNASLELQDGSVIQLAAGGKVSATSDTKSGHHNVEVQTGNAVLTTFSGEKETLSYGDSVSIENGEEIQRNPITVTSVPKEMKVLNLKNEPVPVTIAWKTSFAKPEQSAESANSQNAGTALQENAAVSPTTAKSDTGSEEERAPVITVQTSKTKDFSKIEKEFTVKDTNSVQIDADGGTLYWRVFSEDTKAKPVEGKVTVASIESVAPVSPSAQASFAYRTELPELNLRWNGNDYADHYKVDVSTTPDMRNVVATVESDDCFAKVSDLAEGTYFWQVTPYYTLNDTGYAGESEVSTFSVVKNEQIKPPELFAPQDGAKLTFTENLSTAFTWKSELKNATYDFELSRNEDFSDIVFKKNADVCRVSYDFDKNAPDGKFFWRVVRRSNDTDDIHPESEIRSFTTQKVLPEPDKLLYPPENFSVDSADIASVQFMWRLSDQTKEDDRDTVLQFDRSQDFTNPVLELPATKTSFDNVLLSSGSYYWRVAKKNPATGEAEPKTAPRQITVLKELGGAEIILPKNNSVVLSYENYPVSVSWKKNADADFYNVKVFDADNTLVAQKSSVKGTSATFALPAASYVCTVQPVASATEFASLRTGSVSSVPFSVRSPVAVSQVRPAQNERIAGLSALRSPVAFTWNESQDSSGQYEFLLYKILSDGSRRLVDSTKQEKTSVSLERLSSGTYAWKVRSSSPEGIPLDSLERLFVVEQVPELRTAVLAFPARNYVMGPDYFRKHRSIDFMWEAVPGANSYDFALYHRKKDGSLTLVSSEKGIKDTTVRFKNLKSLDVGDFVWNVTAYSYAKDGFEEQHSKTSSGTFKIDFTLPKKVKVLQTDTQYGE